MCTPDAQAGRQSGDKHRPSRCLDDDSRAPPRPREATRQRWLSSIGDEFREARVSAGLSQNAVGQRIGRSHAQVSRIERGVVPEVSFQTLAVIASALGLDLPLRSFPSGDPLRDAGQLAVLARFRAAVSPRVRHRTEVPLGIPGDRRAWDEVMLGRDWSMPVEAESRVRDTQALRRRLALKCRDARVDRVLLVVADTRHNRRAVRLAEADFREAFPLNGRRAMAALKRGDLPPASALVFL